MRSVSFSEEARKRGSKSAKIRLEIPGKERERDCTKESSFTLASFALAAMPNYAHAHHPYVHPRIRVHTLTHIKQNDNMQSVSLNQSVKETCMAAAFCWALRWAHMLPCLTPQGRLLGVGFFPPSLPPSHLSIIAAKVCRSQHAPLGATGRLPTVLS